jgi:hypothetical protein
LGTIRDIAGAAGALINTITYDSFGNFIGQTNAGSGYRKRLEKDPRLSFTE